MPSEIRPLRTTRSSSFVKRDHKTIHTASRNTDLLFVVRSREDDGSRTSFREIAKKIGEDMALQVTDRCGPVTQFFRDDASPGDCSLDWSDFKSEYLQRVKGQLGGAGSQVIDHLLERGEDFWNVRGHKYVCGELLSDIGLDRYVCDSLGLCDHFVTLALSHQYWENMARMQFLDQPQIESVLGIPAARIKHSMRSSDPTKAQSHADLEQTRRLVTYTFLRFPEGLSATRGNAAELRRGEFLLRLVNCLLPHKVDGEGRDGCWFDRWPFDRSELRLEVYLTYSTMFPVMLKAEHGDYQSLLSFIELLESKKVRTSNSDLWFPEVHTLLGYLDPFKESNGVLRSGEDAPDLEQEDHELKFILLLRFDSPPSEAVIGRIEATLAEISLGGASSSDKPVEVTRTMAQWDYMFHFTPKKLGEAFNAASSLSKEQEQHVARWALVPVLKRDTTIGDAVPDTKIRCVATPAWITDLKDTLRHSRCETPSYGAVRPPAAEILNLRLYDLKFDWEWLAAHLIQLYNDWSVVRKRYCAEHHAGTATFRLIGEIIHGQISVLLERIRSTKQPSSAPIAETKRLATWIAVTRSVKELREIKRHVAGLREAYSEQLECRALLSQTDPGSHLAEPSSIQDMSSAAAHRLFCDYLGSKNPLLKWRGEVVTSLDHDYSVVPNVQLLYMPVDFKLNPFGKFIPLAHEAGHVVLYHTHYTPDMRCWFQQNVLGCWIDSARRGAQAALANQPDHRKEVDQLLDFKLGQRQDETPPFKNGLRINLRLDYQELLCDFLGALVAGPAYYASMLSTFFDPESYGQYWVNEGDGSGHWNGRGRDGQAEQPYYLSQRDLVEGHPPVWIRLRAGVALAVALGWYDRSRPGDDLWNVFARIDRALERHQRTMAHDAICPPERFEHVDFFLMRALEADSNGAGDAHEIPSYIFNLLRFCDKLGDGFLFYPYHKDPVCQHELRQVVDAVCVETMTRLLYNDELVLDRPPRIIAAATMLPSYGRPYHPAGRATQSMYYTHGTAPGLVQEIEENPLTAEEHEELERDKSRSATKDVVTELSAAAFTEESHER